MNRAEREHMLERYLSGELTSAEESDFFIEVALDKELRQELKAQRIIETALSKDCQSEATEHTAMRERVAAMVAASGAMPIRTAPMARPIAGRAAREATHRAPRSPQKRRWALAPMQWLFATGLALSLTVGGVIVMPSGKPAENIPQGIHQERLERWKHLTPPLGTQLRTSDPLKTVPGISGVIAAAGISSEAPTQATAHPAPEGEHRTFAWAVPHSTVGARGATFADRHGASSLRAIEEKSVVTHSAATHTHEGAPSSSVESESVKSEPLKVGVKIQVQLPKK